MQGDTNASCAADCAWSHLLGAVAVELADTLLAELESVHKRIRHPIALNADNGRTSQV